MESHHKEPLVENAIPKQGPSTDKSRDRCVICELTPESNSQIKFMHVYARPDGNRKFYEVIAELLGFKVESGPKFVCENCYRKIMLLDKTFKRISRIIDGTTPKTSDSSQN